MNLNQTSQAFAADLVRSTQVQTYMVLPGDSFKFIEIGGIDASYLTFVRRGNDLILKYYGQVKAIFKGFYAIDVDPSLVFGNVIIDQVSPYELDPNGFEPYIESVAYSEATISPAVNTPVREFMPLRQLGDAPQYTSASFLPSFSAEGALTALKVIGIGVAGVAVANWLDRDESNTPPAFTDNDSTSNNPPTGSDYLFEYNENTAAGVQIGRVTASDPNGDPLTYSITSGNSNNWYAIDANTGVLSLTDAGAASDANDFEAGVSNDHNLGISVSDGKSSTSMTVTLRELNVNEGQIILDDGSLLFEYDENSAAETLLGTIVASDIDGDNLSYSIKSGNIEGWYAVDPNTGAVTLTAAGASSAANDFEADPSDHLLVVTVSDGVLSSDVTLTLREVDINDAPIISADKTVSTAEDKVGVDLVLRPPSDQDHDTLVITVKDLPALGTVRWGTQNLSVDQPLSATELSQLVYDAPTDYNGTDPVGSFQYTVTDNRISAPLTGTVNFDVTPVVDPTVGYVIDGYVSGASIFVIEPDGTWRDTTADTGTDNDNDGNANNNAGYFYIDEEFSVGQILVAVGGTDQGSGQKNILELKAPAGSTVLSPLTTLIVAVMEAGNLSAVTANIYVANALGIPPYDLFNYDPIANNDIDVQKASAMVAMIATYAEANADSGSLYADRVFDNMATTILAQDYLTPIDLTEAVLLDLTGLPNVDRLHTEIGNLYDNSVDTLAEIYTQQQQLLDAVPGDANPIADQQVDEDSAYSFQVPLDTFSDVYNGADYEYSVAFTGPTGNTGCFSFDPLTRTLVGTPLNDDVGDWTIDVTATSPQGDQFTDRFTLTVVNVNDAPTLSAVGDTQIAEDAPFSYDVSGNFNDVDPGDTLSFTATLADGSALPDWLSFSDGVFTGTPTNEDVGVINVKVTASDNSGASVSDSFKLTVTNVNDAPTVLFGIADQAATEDSWFSYTIPANAFQDLDGDNLTYSITAGSLPDGVTFNAATATFSGTPTNAAVGSHPIQITATDSSNALVSTSFNIIVTNVNDSPAISITPGSFIEDGSGFAAGSPAATYTISDIDAEDTLTVSFVTASAHYTLDTDNNRVLLTQAGVDQINAGGPLDLISLKVTDNGSPALTATASAAPTVSEVNDVPTISVTAFDFVEDAGNLIAGASLAGTYQVSDSDSSSLTVTFNTPSIHYLLDQDGRVYLTQAGILQINSGGDLDPIDLKVMDNRGASSTATATPIVTDSNDAPSITVQAKAFVEDDPLLAVGDIVATYALSDTDSADTLTVSFNTPSAYYSLDSANQAVLLTQAGLDRINSGGALDLVDLKVTDNGSPSLTATASAQPVVLAVNDKPEITVTAFSFTEDSGGLVAGSSLAGQYSVTDPDDDNLSVSFNIASSHYTIDQSGNIYLTQAAINLINSGATALDSISLKVTDPHGLFSTASDTPSISPANDAPTITLTPQVLVEGSVTTSSVVATYTTSDPEGDTVTVTFNTVSPYYVLASGEVLLTSLGVAAVNAGDPLDSIDLKATDNGSPALSSTLSAEPVVLYVDDLPTLVVTAYDFVEDSGGLVAGVSLAGNYVIGDEENDALFVTFNTSSSHYTLDQSGNVYLTQAGINQINSGGVLDAIDLKVVQRNNTSYFATDSDTPVVTSVNDAPVTASVTLPAAQEDSPSILITEAQLLSGASDPDGDTLSVSSFSLVNTIQGTLTNNLNGTWSYTPAANDDTSVLFNLTISDPDNATASTTVSLDLTPVNDAPTIVTAPLADMAEDSGSMLITEGDILSGVTDVDGDALSVTSLQLVNSAQGTVVDNNDGTWLYTPADDFNGAVDIKFSVTDGTVTSWGTASLDVIPTPDINVIAPIDSTANDGVGQSFDLVVDLIDAEVGDRLQVFVDGNLIAADTHLIDSTDLISGAYQFTGLTTDANSGGHNISVAVQNSDLEVIEQDSVTYTWS